MLTRSVRMHEILQFAGNIIAGSIGEHAKVTCSTDGVMFTGSVKTHAKINCSGNASFQGTVKEHVKINCDTGFPTFKGTVEDHVEINCQGEPVFHGRVGNYVKVNGRPYQNSYQSSSRPIKHKNVSMSVTTCADGDMIVNGYRVKNEAPKPGREPLMIGVAVGDKFYARIDRIPDEGAIEVTDSNGVATKYLGEFVTTEDGELTIDGQPIRENDDRIISDQPNKKRGYESTGAFVKDILQHVAKIHVVEAKLTPEESFLSNCSAEMISYIKSFEGKKLPSTIVKEMNPPLNEMELAQLFDCRERSTDKFIDRPVILKFSAKFGNVFDFSKILQMIDQGISIQPSQITPSHETVANFENGIQAIIETRKVAQSLPVNQANDQSVENEMDEIVGPDIQEARAPGGPSFR